MQIDDLSYNATINSKRYGYNGKEKDNEMKGNNNSLDFGARIYDPRVSRFLSQDPLRKNFPSVSPFIYATNNPITYIDKNGEFAYAFHYIMTYNSLVKAGIDKVTADKIAYYAATYADHPEPVPDEYKELGIEGYNNWVMSVSGFDPKLLEYRSKQDTKENVDSQSDNTFSATLGHCMQPWWGLLDDKEVVELALYGDETFIGAIEILEKFNGIDLSKLCDDDLKEIGKAIHTVQDTPMHRGGRWVDKHEDEAKLINHKSAHPDAECTLGVEPYLSQAKKATEIVVKNLLNDCKETEVIKNE